MMQISELKKLFGQIMNTKMLVIIFIVGIGLMLLPWNSGDKKQNTQVQDAGDTYKQELETQLEAILSSVKGVGHTEVMITFENDGQTFFASDEKEESQQKEDSRENTQEKTYIIKNDAGGGESPVVVQKAKPEIAGVLVVARGASNLDVKNNVISAVRAVLGVKAHRVEVLERK